MNEEIVVDGVPIGPTEIVTIGTMISALLVLIFHKDWGLAAHIQTLAAQALVILPIVLGVLRSFKHHLSAKVAVARITATAPAGAPPAVSVYTTGSNSPSSSTYGVPSSTTFTVSGVGGVGGGGAANVGSADPNLGTDVTSVDVAAIPEDITP